MNLMFINVLAKNKNVIYVNTQKIITAFENFIHSFLEIGWCVHQTKGNLHIHESAPWGGESGLFLIVWVN